MRETYTAFCTEIRLLYDHWNVTELNSMYEKMRFWVKKSRLLYQRRVTHLRHNLRWVNKQVGVQMTWTALYTRHDRVEYSTKFTRVSWQRVLIWPHTVVCVCVHVWKSPKHSCPLDWNSCKPTILTIPPHINPWTLCPEEGVRACVFRWWKC